MAVQNVKWKSANVQTDENNTFINYKERSLLTMLGVFGGGNISNTTIAPAGDVADSFPSLTSTNNIYLNTDLNAALFGDGASAIENFLNENTNFSGAFGYTLTKRGTYVSDNNIVMFTDTISDSFASDNSIYDNFMIKGIMMSTQSMDSDTYTPLVFNRGIEINTIPYVNIPPNILLSEDVNDLTFPGYYNFIVGYKGALPDDIKSDTHGDIYCTLEVITNAVTTLYNNTIDDGYELIAVKQILHAFTFESDAYGGKLDLNQDIVEYIRFGRPIDSSLTTPDIEHFSMTAAGNMEWGDWHKITYKV